MVFIRSAAAARPFNGAPGNTNTFQYSLDAAKARSSSPPPPPNPEQEAQHVLNAGKRGFPYLTDNYETRMQAFAQALTKGGATYQQQLLRDILKRDPSALDSGGGWLRLDIANNLVRQHLISPHQRSLMAEVMATAYNKGEISPSTMDDVLLSYGSQSSITEFFSSSSGPEVQKFRKSYGEHLIKLNFDGTGLGVQARKAEGLAVALLSRGRTPSGTVSGGISNAESPEQYGRNVAEAVRFLLNSGLPKDHNAAMQEIATLLTGRDSAHVNAVLSHLTEADLEQLSVNIDQGNGLSTAQRGILYQQLASKANATQLVRMMAAMAALHPKAGSVAMNDLTMLTVAIGKFGSTQTQNEVLAQLGRMPQFKALSRMDQFTEKGKPIWQAGNQRLSAERRFALASLLIQEPTLTPQGLIHAQDMAGLSVAVYGGGTKLPAGYQQANFKTDPNLIGALSPADFTGPDGFKAALFYNPTTQTYVLAFRGTTAPGEYGTTNIPQGAGLWTSQYSQAINLARKVKWQLGNRLTDITGHSLGGGLAAAAGMATSTRTTTFDAAGVSPATMLWNSAPIDKAPGWAKLIGSAISQIGTPEGFVGDSLMNPSVVTNYDVRGELLGRVQDYYPTQYLAPSAVGTQITIEPFSNNGFMETEPQISNGTDPHSKFFWVFGNSALHTRGLIVPGTLGPDPIPVDKRAQAVKFPRHPIGGVQR
jgi:hypothetical protein